MIKISPSVRISIGLVFLTVSILIVAEMFGLSPNNQTVAMLDARKKICESLAIQYSMAAQDNNFKGIQLGMDIMVKRNTDIISIGLRGANGSLKAATLDHQQGWPEIEGDMSTPTHAQVPIFNGDKRWGTVEIHFVPLNKMSLLGITISPMFLLILFVAVSGFIGYLFIMKRTLKHLDPSNVMPARVKQALDALSEGVVLLDGKGNIVLANKAFSEKIEKTEDSLLGEDISSWAWVIRNKENESDGIFSWVKAMRDGEEVKGQILDYELENNEVRTFVVNGSPVMGDGKEIRGVLATFYDITDIEEKNIALKEALKQLHVSRDEIQEKNKELKILSEIDPLTGLLNRRRFFDILSEEFEKCLGSHSELAVIMVDIDHFKSINDRLGHVKGDDVIKKVSRLLGENVRSGTSVGRYGGEEFCIFIPNSSVTGACKIAERIRKKFEYIFIDETITASFGVSSTLFKAKTVNELISQADDSLYISKHAGRNRTTLWSPIISQKLIDFKVREEELSNRAENKTSAEITNIKEGKHDLNSLVSEFVENGSSHLNSNSLNTAADKSLFYGHISKAIKSISEKESYGAVFVLGIDKFRRVNEAYGDKVGDDVIVEIGKRIMEFVRQEDMSAWLDKDSKEFYPHIEADIFGLVICDIASIDAIANVATRIIDSMARPIITSKQEVFLTLSVGVSVFPGDGQSPEKLYKRATSALLEAKHKGRSSFNFYNNEYEGGNALEHLEIERDLYQAIQNEEFMLHYQPKVDLRTGAVTSMEALVRWNHPRRGIIQPDNFINIAEDSGLIISLGSMVLKKACNQYKLWSEQGYADVKVAVNLSARQLQMPGIKDVIIDILHEVDIDPHMLELEITETVLMSDIDTVAPLIAELQEVGISISIDDFGVGHSSLNYLKRLPIDILKMDKSFVSDLTHNGHDSSIVSAVVGMAEKMGFKVVAEGIETQDQLKTLIQLGCDEVQGFYFSRPVPADEVINLLSSNNYSEMIIFDDLDQSKLA